MILPFSLILRYFRYFALTRLISDITSMSPPCRPTPPQPVTPCLHTASLYLCRFGIISLMSNFDYDALSLLLLLIMHYISAAACAQVYTLFHYLIFSLSMLSMIDDIRLPGDSNTFFAAFDIFMPSPPPMAGPASVAFTPIWLAFGAPDICW